MNKTLKFALLIAILLTPGCVNSQMPTEAATSINVTLGGIKVADLRLSELAELSRTTLTVNDVSKSGPRLEAVIDEVGIISYMAVTVSGYSPGRGEASSMELDEIDLVSDIIFTIEVGNLSIFGPNIPPEFWDMEITDLHVIACECGL